MRNWKIEPTGEETWKVELVVDSTPIESLKWIWTADVHLETKGRESQMVISVARHEAVGMPEGDGIRSHTSVSVSSDPINGFTAKQSDFESNMQLWENQCRKESASLDRSVMQARTERERKQSDASLQRQNHEQVRDYLNGLSRPGP